jgi:hypothetical protein
MLGTGSAISEMSVTMRLHRSLQWLAMTIGDSIRCKPFIVLSSNSIVWEFPFLERRSHFI